MTKIDHSAFTGGQFGGIGFLQSKSSYIYILLDECTLLKIFNFCLMDINLRKKIAELD